MKKQNVATRFISLLLLLAMLVGILPMNVLAEQVGETAEMRDTSATKAAEKAQVRGYYDICDKIPDYDAACISMQGMAVLGDYVYTAKKNSEDTKATIYRTHRLDGTTELMRIDGADTVDYLGHANDMCATQVGADSYLFVTTMKKTVDGIVCFKISGNTLTKVGIFDIHTAGGSDLQATALDVYEVNGNVVTLFVAQNRLVFLGSFDVTAPADLYCPLGFEIDGNDMLQVARQACGNMELEITTQGAGYYNDTYYMPLTLHHNHTSQIKVDNHADSTSVIVAFPNIADAIKVVDRSVKASLKDTIYVPDAGKMFFEIESVDFADGMMYFSTNRVHVDHSRTFVSVLLDPGLDMKLFNNRSAFRQDGLYLFAGAKATDSYLYDPGAADGHILAGQYGQNNNTYFGLESNSEGFYYIRSTRTGKYLTVNADCTVTTSDRKENDPSQLFCLTQVNWPNEAGHVAIISLLNYQYLNNESGTTKCITTTSGKTYRLTAVKNTTALADYLFDYTLYTACYPEETAGMTEAEARNHYNTVGKAKGYIASLFFDPEYYSAMNPDLKDFAKYSTPEGAYNHFLNYGFWEGRQGSLFFDCKVYANAASFKYNQNYYPHKVNFVRHFRLYGADASDDKVYYRGSDDSLPRRSLQTML